VDFFNNLETPAQLVAGSEDEIGQNPSNILSTVDKNEADCFYEINTDIEVQKTPKNKNWFAGTEDLIRRNV